MTTDLRISAGRPDPMGACYSGAGVNFAVFSENATKIEICLFARDGIREEARIALPERTGHVHHGHVAGLRPGQFYGLRAHGPYAPEAGHRFNPNKLLIDPYARRIIGHPRWSDTLLGFNSGARTADLTFSTRDSARFMPKCSVEDPSFGWGSHRRPMTPLHETVIYEAHVKGLTARMPGVAQPGTFVGLASDPVLEHLTALGVTAVELLPVQAFINDRFLVQRGLVNFWGYQTIGFFAPDPRYLAHGQIAEFQHMVARLHAAGIEVILDVVYNHTGEGDHLGPTLCFRGLDNASYYRLEDGGRHYANTTGCGNSLNLQHPMVLQMVMDSLRHWVEVMGVDGFRFDLATTLARGACGFDGNAPFLAAIRQDPVLRRVKLIAEPWDLGPGGYRLGAFGHPFAEWNDRFRDGVRQFWRGDAGLAPELATRLTGSAQQFDHGGRAATSSVNFVAAHDGFTLMDVVSHARKHNLANGEDNRDGTDANYSDNLGHEGQSDDPAIDAARARRRRNMLATLMLAQGTPMLLAGDEIGNSQNGNNNAYCQDNPTGWVDWTDPDHAFLAFTRRLIAFRKAHPILRQKLFLHSRERAIDCKPDVFWHHASGRPLHQEDWENPALSHVCVELRTASTSPQYATLDAAIFAVFNAGGPLSVELPQAPDGRIWCCEIDTARPEAPSRNLNGGSLEVAADSLVALVLHAAPG